MYPDAMDGPTPALRLLRVGPRGEERPTILQADGVARDCRGIVADFSPDTIGPDLLARLAEIAADLPPVDLAGRRIGAPLARVGTIWCIGLNYADHAAETGRPPPAEPILFNKAASALAGPEDDLRLRPGMSKLDWEVELGVVIGRAVEDADEREATDAVLGYTLVNDLSERGWQTERGGQFAKGKSFPGARPLGPWIATPAALSDPGDLRLRLAVNGRAMQDGTTASMLFGVGALVSYISRFARLEPGDLVCTGTPAGVGQGRTPPEYLRAGDRVEASIDGLGRQSFRIVAQAEPR